MELFIILVGLAILAETSYLTVKTSSIKRGGSKRRIFVDSSALMDGRILEVAKTGFIGDDMVIPRSVVREMQLVADGKDSEKRARARVGLDTVNALERVEHFNVEILQDALDHTPVDERLLELAKKERGAILTCDFNLGKVAATENIAVLNINDLALVLRSEFMPGEQFSLKITGKGQNPGQGIGYLPDGTMVVVDSADSKVGQQVEVEFQRYVQTSAGKMMFARPKEVRKETRNVATKSQNQNPRTKASRMVSGSKYRKNNR